VCFTQNKFCLFQSCHFKLNQVSACLHWPHWWDKWPINTILSSSSPTQWIKSFTQNQKLWRISVDPFKSN
jgi:hypothetical protein